LHHFFWAPKALFNNSPSSQPSPDREKEYNISLSLWERVRVRGQWALFNNSPSSQPSPDREKEYNIPLALWERGRVRGSVGTV